MQQPGAQFAAREVQFATGVCDSLSMELAGAYPADAGIASYHRTLTMDRQHSLVRLQGCWKLQRAESLDLHFMTPVRPRVTLCCEGRAEFLIHAAQEA